MATNNATNTAIPSGVSAGTYNNATVTVNAAGQLTSASSGSGSLLQWNDSTSTPVSVAVNNGYVGDDGATKVVFNLPATCALGSVFAFQGKGTGLFQVNANTGQVINFGTSATSSGGSLTSTNTFDSVSLVCITANTTYAVTSAVGNLTVA